MDSCQDGLPSRLCLCSRTQPLCGLLLLGHMSTKYLRSPRWSVWLSHVCVTNVVSLGVIRRFVIRRCSSLSISIPSCHFCLVINCMDILVADRRVSSDVWRPRVLRDQKVPPEVRNRLLLMKEINIVSIFKKLFTVKLLL